MRYKALTCISLSRFQCSTKSGLSIVQVCVRSKDFVQTITVTRARTLYNSKLPLTRRYFHFSSDRFLYSFTLDSSNYRYLEIGFFSISLEGQNYRGQTVIVFLFVWLVVFRFEILSSMDHRVRKKVALDMERELASYFFLHGDVY